jgi:uncharacterized membrane protein (Fun14 family)
LSTELFAPVVVIGGGFFGGLLLGFALKKVLKLIAVIGVLFIAGLVYLQYQQVASIDWNKIEALVTSALGNATSQISTNRDMTEALAMTNFGIPLTGVTSAGFAVGFMRG